MSAVIPRAATRTRRSPLSFDHRVGARQQVRATCPVPNDNPHSRLDASMYRDVVHQPIRVSGDFEGNPRSDDNTPFTMRKNPFDQQVGLYLYCLVMAGGEAGTACGRAIVA